MNITHKRTLKNKLTLATVMSTVIVASASSNATNYHMSNALGSSKYQSASAAKISATKRQLALMQVMSEVCPGLINSNLRPQFYQAYNTKLQRLMPTAANPQLAMRQLSSQKDYRQLHSNLKSWTLTFSRAENKAICEEMATTRF